MKRIYNLRPGLKSKTIIDASPESWYSAAQFVKPVFHSMSAFVYVLRVA